MFYVNTLEIVLILLQFITTFILDQPHPVKETTDYFESNEKHTETISTERAIQNTITQNGYNFSNFSEIVRHNGKLIMGLYL